MKTVVADGIAEFEFLKAMRSRNVELDEKITASVQAIIGQVRLRGDDAVREYTARFDSVELSRFEVSPREIEAAYDSVPRKIVKALEKAAVNIRDFHERQRQQSWMVTKDEGVILGQRVRGLERVGIYVPGGTAAYPSSVLMNAIPARMAGVKEIIMVTPPGKEQKINPNILAAAKIAGVDRVFAIGGAQAVAALAYGTDTIPKVDKIVGPGNIYVATAKKLVFGEVDIDMIAGPSEILVIADKTADSSYLAADLMSQAEHDRLASAILVTDSQDIAEKTVKELERQMKTLERNEIIRESLENFGAVIICENLNDCVAIANRISPEHLEVMTDHPMELLGSIDNAGSVFLGKYAPEPLGDYYAGPNHVLPTSGTARFFSPLSVDAFVKKSSFIYYTGEALRRDKEDIITLADCEGLTAHANSVKVRFPEK